MEKIRALLKHKDILLSVLLFLFIISFFFVHAEHSFDVTDEPMDIQEAIMLKPGDKIVQELNIDKDTFLTEIQIQFGTYDKKNKGTLHVQLYENGRSTVHWQLDTAGLIDNTYHKFPLDTPLKTDHKNSYSIHISENFRGDNAIAVWTSLETRGACFYNGMPLKKGSLCHQVTLTDLDLQKKVVLVSAVIFSAVAVLLLFHVNETLLMSGIFVLLGCIYMWACPLYMAPDEETHFYRAFEISCGDLTSPHIEGKDGGNVLPSALSYFSDSDTIDWEDTKCFIFTNMSLYAPVSYLPQVTGIKIARFFTDDVPTIFSAGRWGNFLVSIFLCLSALYLMPFGKKILFLIMTLPMALQEMISLAPDGFTISLSMAFTAYVFHVSYSSREKLRKRDIAVIAALSVTLSLCKIVYIVLVLLIFAIPNKKFGMKREWMWAKSGILGASVLLNLLWLKISSGYLVEFTPGVDTPRQIQYILSDMGTFYGTVIRSVIEKGDFYIQTMLGALMGALCIETTPSLWIAFLVFLLFEILNYKRLEVIPHKWDRTVMSLITLGGVGLICTSLYVQWTPFKDQIIEGIQGRYFIPLFIFPALLIIYNNDKKKRDTRYIITSDARGRYHYMILLTLNGITILDMIQYYLAGA